MAKKEDEIKAPEHHPGSIAAEDEQLSLWLNQLWARGEPPERIEAWQSFGKNRRGEMVFHPPPESIPSFGLDDFQKGLKARSQPVQRFSGFAFHRSFRPRPVPIRARGSARMQSPD